MNNIFTLDEFKERFDIFTEGVFKDLVWTGKFVMSGDIISANICMTKNVDTSHCNGTSIDVLYKKQSEYEFIECVENIVKVVKSNLMKITNKDTNVSGKCSTVSNPIKIDAIKKTTVFISSDFISSLVSKSNDINDAIKDVLEKIKLSTINECILYKIDCDILKEYLYCVYVQHKIDTRKKYHGLFHDMFIKEQYCKLVHIDDINFIVKSNINNNIYNSKIFTYSDISKIDNVHDISYNNDNDMNKSCIQIVENIEYIIASEYMERDINIINIPYDNYYDHLKKYPPGLQGFYDGTNVMLYPACYVFYYKLQPKIHQMHSPDPTAIMKKWQSRGFI